MGTSHTYYSATLTSVGWVPVYARGHSEGVGNISDLPSFPFLSRLPLFLSFFFPPSLPFFYKAKDNEHKGGRRPVKAGFSAVTVHLAGVQEPGKGQPCRASLCGFGLGCAADVDRLCLGQCILTF